MFSKNIGWNPSHLKEENTTYTRHIIRALSLSSKMFIGSIFLFIHGFIPIIFEHHGSNIISQLYNNIKNS